MNDKEPTFVWARRGGYEVSTQGDARFSPFNAYLPDGRNIETHYQCDVKGYDPGGRNWRLGKGKKPLRKDVDLAQEFLNLWRLWARDNMPLVNELRRLAAPYTFTLSDCFATSPVNQAWALSVILNETRHLVRVDDAAALAAELKKAPRETK